MRSRSLDQIAGVLTDDVPRALQARSACLALSEQGRLARFFHSPGHPYTPCRKPADIDVALAGAAVSSASPMFQAAPAHTQGVNAAALPLCDGDRELGALTLYWENDQPADDELLDMLAGLAGAALGRALDADRLAVAPRELSGRDSGPSAWPDDEPLARLLMESLPGLIWITDNRGKPERFNQRWFDYTGQQIDEGEWWRGAVHPEDSARTMERWMHAVETGVQYETEYRLRRYDGAYRWFLARGIPIRGDDGAVVRWVGASTDIDEQKRLADENRRLLAHEKLAREAAEASEARLTFLAEAGTILGASLDYETTLASVARLAVPHLADWCSIHVVDESGRARQIAVVHSDPAKVAWAEELRKRFPYDPESAHGVPAVIRTGEPQYAFEIPEGLIETIITDPERLECIRQLGLCSVMLVPMNARDATVGAISFVATRESGRRYTENDLVVGKALARRAALAIENARLYRATRESERRMRLALDVAGMATWDWDFESGAITWSGSPDLRGFLAAGSGTLDAFIRKVHPDEQAELRADMLRAANTGSDLSGQFRVIAADGVRWMSGRGTVVSDAGRSARMVGIVVDVTERHSAAETHERLAAIIHSTDDAIVSTDLNGIVTSWNAAAERIYGYSAAEMMGRSKAIVIPPEHQDEFDTILQTTRAGRHIENYDTIRLRKDGGLIDVSVTVSPLRSARGEIIGGSTIARDITYRKAAADALRASEEQLRSVNNRLRRAMEETHHRVKNNLQIICALIDMELHRSAESIPAERMQELGNHVQALSAIHGILTRQARDDAALELVSVLSVMSELLQTLRGMVAARRIESAVDDVLLPVRHVTALAVLCNELISNAVKHGRGRVSVAFRVSDQSGTLSVSDEGKGFPVDFRDPERGSSGLELVESLAAWDLNGDVRYENPPEGGAVVRIAFPLPAAI